MSEVLEGLLSNFSDSILEAYADYSKEDLLKEQWYLLEGINSSDLDPHIKTLYGFMQTIVAATYTNRYEKSNIH